MSSAFSSAVALLGLIALTTATLQQSIEKWDCSTNTPPPPNPEPIEIYELKLPPVTLNNAEGGCTAEINPRGTGCIPETPNAQNGNFLPDGNHIVASLKFTGAPAAPAPASIYCGDNLILLKTDGTTFPNGDSWKCITCGVPANQQLGRNNDALLDYPQAFTDGKRVLVGTNIVDCSPYQLASKDCTPNNTWIYPLRWNVNADGSGVGGSIRELRKHPDDIHIGFNAMTFENGHINQHAYFARLEFNPNPTTGLPLSARYDFANVTGLYSSSGDASIFIKGNQMFLNPDAIAVGELRGLSRSGHEVKYIGAPRESCNIDIFACDLTTGVVRRLTSHPEYVDPVDSSPDDQWMAIMDGRGTNRQMWIAGMRGLPPITDLISTAAVASTRNNGQRRFFTPILLDRYGDRGVYYGQVINAAGDGSPGSINDPQWNGRADPRWSWDGTRIAYYQQMTVPPACGGINPLVCPNSTEPGARIERIMVAHLINRKPVPFQPVAPVSDTIPWGTPYIPGAAVPVATPLPEGNYTLVGKICGSANVTIIHTSDKTNIATIRVSYTNYSDDGENFISGTEEVTNTYPGFTSIHLDWHSNLTSRGISYTTKITSPEGFHLDIDLLTNILEANGTLTTTVDGVVYLQPANGT